MGVPGGKISRPKTELQKKLFKRRRDLSLPNRKKRQIVGAVEELITVCHPKKRSSSAPPSIILAGKKKRELLKQLCHTSKETTEMQVDISLGPKKTIGKRKTEEKQTACLDVEMIEAGTAPEWESQELPLKL